MRTLTVAALVVALSWLPGCRSGGGAGESYNRAGFDFSTVDLVAVVDVVGAVESENIKNQIADFFSKQLLRKGFGPVERQVVRRQLVESNAQLDPLKDEAYAIEAGRILKVPAVLIVHVPNFGEETSITAKILEVASGSTLWVGSGSKTKGHGSWWSLSDEEFDKGLGGGIFNSPQGPYATGEEQKKKEQQRRAQRTMSVREAKETEKIVKEICKSLPYKLPDLKPEDSFLRMPKVGGSK